MIGPTTQTATTPTLEEMLNQLEKIARRIEEPGTSLTEAIALVERGAVLSDDIERELARCDEHVQALITRLRPAES